jgi:mannosylglycoprotein endo-beta-mannosidase
MGSDGGESAFRLGDDLWPEQGCISRDENEALELSFTGEELDEVLASMKVDSASGPDDLPVAFFKRFWEILKGPILGLLNDFALGRVDIARLNFGILTLIPKVRGADNVNQFRPIALINVIFKFIAKVYAIRLAPLVNRTIDRSQMAFIKGRALHEGVLALHEIAHELAQKKLGGLFLKLDFEKAYDRVSWDFLREVLKRKGFSAALVQWLMQLVSGGQTMINVNGEIGPYFRNARGVRQGDPLSSILFDFMVDALAAMISRASSAGHIWGVVSHLIPGGVTHLQYADDTMILLEPYDEGISNLKLILLCFEDLSGLKINLRKSEVVVVGRPTAEKVRIGHLLNC